MRNGLDKRIDEGVLQWFGHVERMERDRIAKGVYVGEYADSHSLGRPWKRKTHTRKECLKKRRLNARQARRRFQDKSEWWGFVRGECMGHNPGEEPLTLMRFIYFIY